MKKNYQGKTDISFPFTRLLSFIAIISTLLLCSRAEAKFRFDKSDGDTAEKRVDYLEQIYFSGDDKDGIDQDILIAIQDIQKKQRTEALTKQMTFLLEVQPKISEAGSTCDALDLLAVGIYNIDAAEAVQQGVKMPSSKAKEKSVDAVAALNSISNSARNTSEQATGLAWSSILYSGKYTSVASKASKVAGAANTLGAVTGMAGQAAGAAKQAGSVLKGLGIGGGKKKKACNDVPQKAIALGEHKALPPPSEVKLEAQAQQPVIVAPVTPAAGTAKLTIKSITYAQMNTIKPSIEKIAGVTAVTIVGYSESIK